MQLLGAKFSLANTKQPGTVERLFSWLLAGAATLLGKLGMKLIAGVIAKSVDTKQSLQQQASLNVADNYLKASADDRYAALIKNFEGAFKAIDNAKTYGEIENFENIMFAAYIYDEHAIMATPSDLAEGIKSAVEQKGPKHDIEKADIRDELAQMKIENSAVRGIADTETKAYRDYRQERSGKLFQIAHLCSDIRNYYFSKDKMQGPDDRLAIPELKALLTKALRDIMVVYREAAPPADNESSIGRGTQALNILIKETDNKIEDLLELKTGKTIINKALSTYKSAMIGSVLAPKSVPTFSEALQQVLSQEKIAAAGAEQKSVRVMETTFTGTDINGKTIQATEKAERANTIELFMNGLKTKQAALEKELADENAKPEAIKEPSQRAEQLAKLLAETKADIDIYSKTTKNVEWVSTNATRFAFKTENRALALTPPDKIKPEQKAAYEAAKIAYAVEFAEIKEHFAPIPINLRMQTVTDSNGVTVSAISRSGAISDFGHGEISLQELQDYPDLLSLSQGKPVGYIAMKKLVTLYDLQLPVEKGATTPSDQPIAIDPNKLQQLVLTIKGRALKGYGSEKLLDAKAPYYNELSMENLTVGPKEKGSLCRLLEKLNTNKLSLQELEPLKNIGLDSEKLKTIIEQRRKKLEPMWLQDIYLHLNTFPAAGASTLFQRISLLDMQKNAKNDSGCILNERTMGLDMKALYDKIDGRTIKFDLDVADTGPYIDDEGAIHMPISCSTPGINETTINAVLFNVSVQGNTGNTGLQKAINDAGLAKLAKLGVNVDDLRKKLAKGDRYKAIELLNEAGKTVGGRTSANCYGGKDRTGAVCAGATLAAIRILQNPPGTARLTDKMKDDVGKKRQAEIDDKMKADVAKWRSQLRSAHGTAGNIAHQNAGHRALKIVAWNSKLYGINPSGIARRIFSYLQAGIMGVRAKLGKFYTSEAEGQLYKEKPQAKRLAEEAASLRDRNITAISPPLATRPLPPPPNYMKVIFSLRRRVSALKWIHRPCDGAY